MSETMRLAMAGLCLEADGVSPALRSAWRDYEASVDAAVDAYAVVDEQTRRMAAAHNPEANAAQLEEMCLTYALSQAALRFDCLTFHCSAVALHGQAYLFAAASGVGKSTHARMWRQVFGAAAVMINDDMPMLRRMSDGWLACGTPWMGKHALGGNIMAPVRALCLLSRAEQTRLVRCAPQEALPGLMNQAFRPFLSQDMNRVLDLLGDLATHVPIFSLQCPPESEAARIAHDLIEGECNREDSKGL